MQEKRKYTRLPKAISIAYASSNTSEKEKLSYSRNIGRGGVCLVVHEELKESNPLDLTIYLPEDKVPLNAKGKVIWVNEFTTDGIPRKHKIFYAGIAFTDIAEEDAGRIDKYVHSILSTEP